MNCNLYCRKRIHVCYAVVSEGVNLSGYLPNEGCSTRLVIGCAECPKCLKQSGHANQPIARRLSGQSETQSETHPPQAAAAAAAALA